MYYVKGMIFGYVPADETCDINNNNNWTPARLFDSFFICLRTYFY